MVEFVTRGKQAKPKCDPSQAFQLVFFLNHIDVP